VRATCGAGELQAGTSPLAFGEAFLGREYGLPLVLRNPSADLPARFVTEPQDPQAAAVAAYTVTPSTGVVPPGGELEVRVGLSVRRMGPCSLPLRLSVRGWREMKRPPLEVELTAEGVGARVEAEPPVLDFGAARCLLDKRSTVTLRNTGDIPARVKAFVVGERSKFRLASAADCDFRLAAGEAREVAVLVTPDDASKCSDELGLQVTSLPLPSPLAGDDEDEESEQARGNEFDPASPEAAAAAAAAAPAAGVRVPLRARGMGTTIWSDSDMSLVDFGPVLSGRPHEREFVLENKGRRAVTLQWANATAR